MAVERIFDLSGGIQTATNWVLRAPNEVEDAENARFDKYIGAPTGRDGYTLHKTIADGETVMGVHESKFDTGAIILVASDNGVNTVVRAYDPKADTVETIIDDLPRNVKCQFIDHLNETYMAGMNDTERIQIHNIRVDKDTGDILVSTTRNLYTSPKAAYIGENSGKLYAMNVSIGGEEFPDRAYESSPPMGAITYVKGRQENTVYPRTLVSQVPKMTGYTVPSGVASATSEANTNTRAWKAFDGDSTTGSGRWVSGSTNFPGTPQNLQYDFGAGNEKIIQHVTIKAINDTDPSLHLSRAPKNYKIQGSNDGSTYTDLHTVVGDTWSKVGEVHTLNFNNTTAYRYYRIHITGRQGGGNDTFVQISEMTLSAPLEGPDQYRQMAVDSTRYIKSGMELDIYKSGTDEKLRTITVHEVNRADGVFTFIPFSQEGILSDYTKDELYLSSGDFDVLEFATGSPIELSGTGVAPGGLAFNTTYYVIRVPGDDTKIKLAETRENAEAGIAINTTNNGSGSFKMTASYLFEDNDEVWLHNRHEELSVLWNVDNPSKQEADYLRISPGITSDSAISGWAKSNNRLFIFTPTSMHQWDNANFLPVFEDVGCMSHWTIQNSATWLLWMDAEGRIRARDSASGQDEIISRFVRNKYLDQLSGTNIKNAVASMFNTNYKVAVGQVGDKYWRLVYDFDSNAWWRETHLRDFKFNFISRLSGKDRLYQVTDGPVIYLDDEGNDDAGNSIPFVVHYGRRNFGTEFAKGAVGMYVLGKNISGASLMIKRTNDGDWTTLGQLTEPVSRITVPSHLAEPARDFDIKIAMNTTGARPVIEGLEFHYQPEENNFG